MKQQTKNILIGIFQAGKVQLLAWLEKEAVKVAIANLIKRPFMADFRIWAVKLAVDYLADQIVKPVIDFYFRKVGYEYEVLDGKHLLKKIANSADVGEWDRNTDRV